MRVYIAAVVAASTLAVTSASASQSMTTNWFNNIQDVVEDFPFLYEEAQQYIFMMMGGKESELTTTIPFGTVDGKSSSGNCNSNECLGSSCYDCFG